ncbi:type 1 glutamine amidotransferase domain-containing protein [Exiguobacterium sp. FSL W8-0210]|uniref:type 1 glutamine amidotransferase domain-containing protein n=1 Tax=unclassified Exiguobacterium TaxID=2644629 RepID=UPI000B3F5A17|nr:type 1 glutamine amidotransferase domain-containing protein [Exiguobacterium sp. UBA5002]
MSKKVAVVLADHFEDVEFTGPVDALKEAGHEITVIGAKKGAELVGKQEEAKVTVDLSIDETSAADYDALLIPGGFSPDLLREDERFVSFVEEFDMSKKPIFSICHGPQLMINAKIVKGRKMTGYKSIRIDLENAGVDFADEEVVVDDNFVSSRQPDDIPAFNREIVAKLG